MDKRNPESREVEELLEKKKDLFSLFSAFEDRIDHKISHLADSAEIPVESIKEKTEAPSDRHSKDPVENLFEQAVLKSQQKSHQSGIIGFHTEEILGVEDALAEIRKAEAADVSEPAETPAEVFAAPEEPVISTQPEPLETPCQEPDEPEPAKAAATAPADIAPDINDTPDAADTSETEIAEISEPAAEAPASFESDENPDIASTENTREQQDEGPMELPLGVDEPDLDEIDELLQEAEDLMEDIPYSRYMTARAAVDKELLDDNPMEAHREDTDTETDGEEEPFEEEFDDTDDADSPETDSHEYDALFEEDDFEDDEDFSDEDQFPEGYLDNDPPFDEEEDEVCEEIPEDEAAPEESFWAEADEAVPEEELSDSEPEHPFADFFEDTAETVKEDLFDDLPLDEAPDEEYSDNNLDDVIYENVDAVSLGAFKYSAVSLRLMLFVAAMLGMGVFTALSSGRFIAIDYLILFVLCIFVALTMDMSFNATLIATVVIMLGCFGGLIYTFFTGGEVSMFHMFWFIIIPACLLTASGLVQKIKEVILANQLLNEELDGLYAEQEDALSENEEE